jgi:plastocyanin domain-containing protein
MTKKQAIFLTLILLAIIFSLAIKLPAKPTTNNTDNVVINNNQQTIAISAKGGYVPQNTNAKANTPTVLKVNTQGTFDCSASLVIPDLGYKQFLPPQGTTEITIPPQKPGTSLTGVCSMGMYNFTINFN